MNKRLVDLIVYLVSSCSSLPRTNLVKLLYLVDWNYFLKYGKTFTGVEYQFHHYGPYADAIVSTCEELAPIGLVCSSHWSKNDRVYFAYSIKAPISVSLPSKVKDTCDAVLSKVNPHNLEELLDVAYSTPPMKYTSRGEVIDFAKFRVNKKADDLRNRARARMASFHTRKLTSEDAAIRAKDLEPLIALQYDVISNQH